MYSFGANAGGGANPPGGVALGGLSGCGGDVGCGAVFQLQPPVALGDGWTEVVLHEFTGGNGGGVPYSGPVVGKNGVVYGATESGGAGAGCPYGCGTVFALTPPALPGGTWTETVLHAFSSNGTDGIGPSGLLVIGAGGVLYGVTGAGGNSNYGTVFQLSPQAAPRGKLDRNHLVQLHGSER